MDICYLCKRRGYKGNPLNNHHIHSVKKNPTLVMRVHSKGCHRFADWITEEFILRGKVETLTAETIAYFFRQFPILGTMKWNLP